MGMVLPESAKSTEQDFAQNQNPHCLPVSHRVNVYNIWQNRIPKPHDNSGKAEKYDKGYDEQKSSFIFTFIFHLSVLIVV